MYTAIECWACGIDIPQDEEMLIAYLASKETPIVLCDKCKSQPEESVQS